MTTVKNEPREVFKWSRKREWERVMFEVLGEQLDPKVVEAVRQIRQPYLLESNCVWMSDLAATVRGGRNDSLVDTLARGLRLHYQSVILFHGCRPVSLDSYKMRGLCPSDTNAILNQAQQLFGCGIGLENADHSIGQDYKAHNHGKVWLSLTKESYWRSPAHHQHYLEHGSEFLSGLANRCGESETVRLTGIPVVIECKVFSPELPLNFWPSLSQAMLWDWANRLWQPRKRTSDSTLCTTVETTIPPDRIHFHHFKEIRKRITVSAGLGGEDYEMEKVRFQPLTETL